MDDDAMLLKVLVMATCLFVAFKALFSTLDIFIPHSADSFGCGRCLLNKILPFAVGGAYGLFCYLRSRHR